MSTRKEELEEPTTTIRMGESDASGFSSGYPATPPRNRLDEPDEEPNRWHAGLDFGLLILRLALGATLGAHGLAKFGLFQGPGIGGFAESLGMFGYTTQETVLAWITAVVEVGGGALLILGLFTPLGAAAALGVLASAVYAKYTGGFFVNGGAGFEYELMLALVAFALLFTGSGRVALDKNTPWRRKPAVFGLVALVLAGAAAAMVNILFR
jgi:putative oxidoreductase